MKVRMITVWTQASSIIVKKGQSTPWRVPPLANVRTDVRVANIIARFRWVWFDDLDQDRGGQLLCSNRSFRTRTRHPSRFYVERTLVRRWSRRRRS